MVTVTSGLSAPQVSTLTTRSASSFSTSPSNSASLSVRDAFVRTSGYGAAGSGLQLQALSDRPATTSVYSTPCRGQSAVGCDGARNPPELLSTSRVTDELQTESLPPQLATTPSVRTSI